jgi:hypothetical protein
MSSHTDTIRDALLDLRLTSHRSQFEKARRGLAALDALEAELQRKDEALRRIAAEDASSDDDGLVSDSGHGIVFTATELPRGARRMPTRSSLSDYVREHMEGDRV